MLFEIAIYNLSDLLQDYFKIKFKVLVQVLGIREEKRGSEIIKVVKIKIEEDEG